MTTDSGSRLAASNGQLHAPITWLVTGAAGFIGSHLSDALVARGDTVLGLDNLTTGRIENVQHLLRNPRFHFARADVSDAVVMDRLASQATIIVHLAAAVGVELVVERPAYTIETNVMGTEAVLRAALRYGNRVLLASTSEVYGKGSRIPFGEDDDILLGPTSKSRWGYAASKMVDEFLGMAYYHEHGLEVVPFRLFNTTGPRQSSRYGMVVPRFVRQALRNEPITIYGDGSQRRCFCDVQDVVRAIVALSLHSEAPGRTYNIGNTQEISILQLAEQIREQMASESPVVMIPYEQAYAPGFEDMQRRVPDIARIQALIGWNPEIPLTRTLERIRADLDAGTVQPAS
ncbi:MAG: GDP-mannose 4,6-dehydratase [Thermomicrobiales bacterium]